MIAVSRCNYLRHIPLRLHSIRPASPSNEIIDMPPLKPLKWMHTRRSARTGYTSFGLAFGKTRLLAGDYHEV